MCRKGTGKIDEIIGFIVLLLVVVVVRELVLAQKGGFMKTQG